jgi:hypothetical protein
MYLLSQYVMLVGEINLVKKKKNRKGLEILMTIIFNIKR